MKYKILYSNDIEELESMVNEYLRKGWRCIGTLVVVPFEYLDRFGPINMQTFYQTIVGEIK